MKRGTVIAGFEVRTDQGLCEVPAGPCWVIEGALWVKLVWQAGGTRETVAVSLRDYQGCVQRGQIRFSTAPSVDYTIRRSTSALSYCGT